MNRKLIKNIEAIDLNVKLFYRRWHSRIAMSMSDITGHFSDRRCEVRQNFFFFFFFFLLLYAVFGLKRQKNLMLTGNWKEKNLNKQRHPNYMTPCGSFHFRTNGRGVKCTQF